MEMDEKDNDREKKLRGLWNDAKRYKEVRDEVRQSLFQSHETRFIIPFYRKKYFAIAASLVILIGISAILIFIIHQPSSNSGKDELTIGKDTILKLQMDKPEAKARQEIYRDELLLQWNNKYDTISHLVVFYSPNGKIVYRKEIKPAQLSYKLPKCLLQPGKYEWYVGDKKFKKCLIIDH
jgi:hypothetical protein